MGIKNRYLIFVWGDVEPEVWGPYPTDNKRDEIAREAHEQKGPEHGLYGADVLEDGTLKVWSYSGAFFNEAQTIK